MSDCVLDASVVAFSNGDIAGRRPGNVFDRRLAAIERVVSGERSLRYNSKLLGEYKGLVRVYRNDVIELLFIILADKGVLVKRNTLSRQEHAVATGKCRWPSHDQHLLAAAVGGIDPVIVVTESHLASCAARVLTYFAVYVEHLA
jgi:hypothetical protein